MNAPFGNDAIRAASRSWVGGTPVASISNCCVCFQSSLEAIVDPFEALGSTQIECRIL